ncbi:protein FAM110C-like [Amblyraja radiata]|uniref:protein FAM110C-like n=1 Tax=Amblyraja radiata TaxID=386614 RepID=UPI00140327A4|nr:protein FAM110C-like [Amblyraja radiata]
MPSEIATTVSMLPLRLMTKGPGYLRNQMEGDWRGRQSTAERLAANKAKYLKSQTTRGCKVEPNGLGSSASEEDSNSCRGASSSTKTYLASGSPQQSEQLGLPTDIVRRSTSKKQLRPDSLVTYRQKCEFVRGAAATSSSRGFKGSGSLVRRLLPGSRGRGDKQQGPATGAATSEGGELAEGTEAAAPQDAQVATPAALQGETAASPATPQGAQGAQVTTPAAPREAAVGRPKELLKRRVGEGRLRRSHADHSCHFSRACSGLDSFLEHCGLEPEVIENLAREKFAAFESLALKFRSVKASIHIRKSSRFVG